MKELPRILADFLFGDPHAWGRIAPAGRDSADKATHPERGGSMVRRYGRLS